MNKYEKAKKKMFDDIVEFGDKGNYVRTTNEDINNITELVDRATPKKPVIINKGPYDTPVLVCPTCGRQPNFHTKPNHCTDCGQKFDWRSENANT